MLISRISSFSQILLCCLLSTGPGKLILILFDLLQIVNQAIITDKPVFTYRGIMMDTARNFISLPRLKRLIDGMSYSKLNMFHWHITDTHSFPFYSKTRPMVNSNEIIGNGKIALLMHIFFYDLNTMHSLHTTIAKL